ncbi:MAG: restriction endonuclease, partial [Chthoniobacteraceae bacterium]
RYDRILTLRTISKAPNWHYELVEIPKPLLAQAKDGKLEMKLESKQSPKPGYCHVRDADGQPLFHLDFDAGSERKLQIKALRKSACVLHAEWKFTSPSA